MFGFENHASTPYPSYAVAMGSSVLVEPPQLNQLTGPHRHRIGGPFTTPTRLIGFDTLGCTKLQGFAIIASKEGQVSGIVGSPLSTSAQNQRLHADCVLLPVLFRMCSDSAKSEGERGSQIEMFCLQGDLFDEVKRRGGRLPELQVVQGVSVEWFRGLITPSGAGSE